MGQVPVATGVQRDRAVGEPVVEPGEGRAEREVRALSVHRPVVAKQGVVVDQRDGRRAHRSELLAGLEEAQLVLGEERAIDEHLRVSELEPPEAVERIRGREQETEVAVGKQPRRAELLAQRGDLGREIVLEVEHSRAEVPAARQVVVDHERIGLGQGVAEHVGRHVDVVVAEEVAEHELGSPDEADVRRVEAAARVVGGQVHPIGRRFLRKHRVRNGERPAALDQRGQGR